VHRVEVIADRPRMRHGVDERELVGQLGQLRVHLVDPHPRHLGGDGGKLLGGITQKGQPNADLMNQITDLNTFWSMISQKTNNNIQSGTQTNLVQPSSNDTSLGQQASQSIQAMGECMKTRAS